MANPAHVEELVKRIETDPSFTARLAALTAPADKRALLDSNGFADLTPEDLAEYREQTMPQLSDEDLQHIAGGAGDPGDPQAQSILTAAVIAAVVGRP